MKKFVGLFPNSGSLDFLYTLIVATAFFYLAGYAVGETIANIANSKL